MSREYLRTFLMYDFDEVTKHLIIFGDLSSDCGACRALGIDGYAAPQCPECGTIFKYATSRRAENFPGERYQLVRRIAEKRPDLKIIDYGDYQKTLGHKKARDFFA